MKKVSRKKSPRKSKKRNASLIRRETIAAMVLQGLVSDKDYGFDMAAIDAVMYADALIAQLDQDEIDESK